MPRRDGTGPSGAGTMTGRGLGFCTGSNLDKCSAGLGLGAVLAIACRRGLGRGNGRGFRRGFRLSEDSNKSNKSTKELLQEQKELLENRLEFINEELGKL